MSNKELGTMNESRSIPPGRRDFLRVGSLGALGLGLSRFLELKSLAFEVAHGKAEACILLWLEGGPSQVDDGAG